MESKESTCGLMCCTRPLPGSSRYYPYTTGSDSRKEEMKEEVVQLGVELSLSLAESMFLLRDDIHTMLCFCRKLWKYTIPPSDPVSQTLLLVIHSVYSKEIKLKKEVCGGNISAAQWELIRSTWRNFTDGVIVLRRFVLILRSKDNNSYDDRLLSSAILKYKQGVLKKLDDKLRTVSEANGFSRETVKSDIFDSWKSLFDEEATPQVIRDEIVSEMFSLEPCDSQIQALPIYYPYILGKDFAVDELKEEAVRLGAELSLYVAESMLLLCDDIRSTLLFCMGIWRDVERDRRVASPVTYKLLHAIHYVYSRHIKPRKGVVPQENGGKSVNWVLVLSNLKNVNDAIRELHALVLKLTVAGGRFLNGREHTSRVEEALKKVAEKLSSEKARDDDTMIKSNISELWKSLFDQETKSTPWTRRVIREEMLSDLFPRLTKNISYLPSAFI